MTAEPVEALIRGVPFFSALDRLDVARLTGALEEVAFAADTVIFSEGADADALYLLDEGQVTVSVRGPTGERSVATLRAPAHFGELGLLLGRRTGSARAATDVRAWKLSRERFERVARERGHLGLMMATSLAELLDRRSREHAGVPITTATALPIRLDAPRPAPSRLRRNLSFALAIGVPVVLWTVSPPAGLTARGWHVGLIVIGAVLAWLTEPVPDFVVALAMVTAWGLTGLVPLGQALAGFTSSSYIVALSALGLAAAMSRSGLLYRVALRLLRTFPPSYSGQVLALLVGGALVTPLMPLSIARVAAIAPLAQELAHGLGYPPRSRGSAGLAFAGILGYAAFSSVFFTGLAMNFYVFALMPAADRAQFSWSVWFLGAAPAGLILFLGCAAMLLVGFRPTESPRIAPAALERQRRVLGPLASSELVTIIALAVLLLGLVAQPTLRIDSAWVAATALIIGLTGEVLNRESFRNSIEWGFLALFGVLLGTGGVLHGVGIDGWIANLLVPLVRSVGSPAALVMLLALAIVAARLALPWIPATLLLSLALVPAAPRLGLAPWIAGFVVLVTANAWLNPRQSDYCRLVRDATEGEMFTERHARLAGVGLTVLTLLALAVSLPYWKFLGILTR
ncbi:MAG TPA: SLC13 family permease [bacterium]|nr:SLC13 family permease [bacterium]